METNTKVHTHKPHPEVMDMEKLQESVKIIVRALNTGCAKGAFTLDDAYLLKIASSNVEKGVKLLDEYQKLVLSAQTVTTSKCCEPKV